MRARAAVTALLLAASICACGRQDRTSPEEIRLQIARLERERDELRVRLDGLLATDEGARSMPETPVRIGVPTSLARRLIETVSSGFVDQITLQLSNLKAKKSGTVRKVVTIGAYDLDVTIDRVSGKLRTTRPDVHFEGNAVKLALPVRVASGSGQATVRFKWDGRNLAGAACGDLDVEQVVSGSVKPRDYSVSGTLQLQATGSRILITPRIPPLRVKLEVEPSKQSWDAVQAILDSKAGVCGFVLDKVDVLGIVRGIVAKGFVVRLPTEKIKPMAIPIGIEPTISVKGRPVELGIRLAELSIARELIWLGASVEVK